jgi:hypothetical protein
MPFSSPEQCRRHAAQCERLAATASNTECRELWLWLAKRWLALSDSAAQARDLELAISET